jgi:hypothetical protein
MDFMINLTFLAQNEEVNEVPMVRGPKLWISSLQQVQWSSRKADITRSPSPKIGFYLIS